MRCDRTVGVDRWYVLITDIPLVTATTRRNHPYGTGAHVTPAVAGADSAVESYALEAMGCLINRFVDQAGDLADVKTSLLISM